MVKDMTLLSFAVTLLDNNTKLPKTAADNSQLQRALTLTYIIVGAIALMLLVIAGFRWVISEGQPQQIAEARRMIIYIFVGVLVVALAATIVTAALGHFK